MKKTIIYVNRNRQEQSRKGNVLPSIIVEGNMKNSGFYREVKILGPSRMYFDGKNVVLETESEISGKR